MNLINQLKSNRQNKMAHEEMIEGFGGGMWSWLFFKKYNLFDTVRSISICYGLFALLLGFLAILTAVIFVPLQEYDMAYANYKGCITNSIDPTKQHNSASARCEVTFEITKQMNPPILFLYYVENAYINHRNEVNSMSEKQLQGNLIDIRTAQSQCQPFVFNKDMGKNVSWSGKPLDPQAIASPCGFKAFLFFNDTFKLKKIESSQVTDIKIDETQITQNQGIGINHRSRNPDEQWINPADQHFMNWMQNQALMNKQKLWGRINTPLTPGKYSLIVENRYKINTMRLTKGVRIMETSNMGGKSYVFPIMFGIFAVGCGLYAIIFYKKFNKLDVKPRDD